MSSGAASARSRPVRAADGPDDAGVAVAADGWFAASIVAMAQGHRVNLARRSSAGHVRVKKFTDSSRGLR